MKAYLIAGESSGDKLGAAMMSGLKSLRSDMQFQGVAGPLMQAQGMGSLFPMDELSVMGLAEILPKYRQLVARIDQVAADVVAAKPDVLITIDSPDFCHRVARRVRRAAPDIPITHYVAPSVWAWRRGRAAKMAGHVDQVLALLPFEPPYMTAHGMRCDFVGHPVVAEPAATAEQIAGFRAAHELGARPILLALPGSRRNEISRLLPVFEQAVTQVLAKRPELQVVIPAAPGVAEAVTEGVSHWPTKPLVLDPRHMAPDAAQAEKRTAFAAADVAIAASGTVSLELAAAQTPMVIAYDLNWFSWQILSRMVNLNSVTLVNLITGTHTIPEFLGPNCRADAIAEATLTLIENAPSRDAQLMAMQDAMIALGAGGEDPGLRAARAVLDALDG